MKEFMFTGFAAADLFGEGGVHPHAVFTLPAGATLEITVTDDEDRLSGDAFFNEKGDDFTGQTATIVQNGAEIGTGGRLYAERTWHVSGSDGKGYTLVELEQPGNQPDTFTFLGAVPPAGVRLTVENASNVFGAGLKYADLGAGDLATGPENIIDIAVASPDFEILELALGAAGLVETVRGLNDITVFAPTDAAFAQLAIDLGYTGDTESAGDVFGFLAGALASLAPDGDPIPVLTDVLLYHVSPGAKSADAVNALEAVPTLLTGVTFGSENGELVDNDPTIPNPMLLAEVVASNGTIQVIDRVLLPVDLPEPQPEPEPEPEPEPLPTLAGIVAASGGTFDDDNTDFDLLLTAADVTGLVPALDDPSAMLTVFAPTDAAFIGLAQTLGFAGSDEAGAFDYLVEALTLLSGGTDPIGLLQTVLEYHVAPTVLDSTAVLGASEIATLQGGSLGVDGLQLVDADPDVPNPTLIATDIAASNGIAHVIDGVLLPVDVLKSGGGRPGVDFIIADDEDNTIFTGRDNDLVDGNEGRDVISLGRGDDLGLGGAGNDVIFGGSGDDTIIGGTGDDDLFGGRGADVFIFMDGDGHDEIRRFEQGKDLIDLSATSIASFDDLMQSAHGHRGGVRLDLGADQSITVQARNLTLTEDDFIF